ncbi:hypothetical protein HMPREF9442_02575 [Paraprevotella xylaniphila YIT 11841]|uniref:Uncharacterized protein n=1 Tax=Paraprevotella xylaniphila YIT 11841 TaxID=762982 RepID=F3QWJ3_9BACT|nr:hypothetical protein HMPREF9442_02575 [Paraprevotella xylaniphila YIT 11841]
MGISRDILHAGKQIGTQKGGTKEKNRGDGHAILTSGFYKPKHSK